MRACSSAPCSTLGWPNEFSYVESIFYPAIIHQWVRGEFKNVLKLSISETCLLVFCCLLHCSGHEPHVCAPLSSFRGVHCAKLPLRSESRETRRSKIQPLT